MVYHRDEIDLALFEKVQAYLRAGDSQREQDKETTQAWARFYGVCDGMMRRFASQHGVPVHEVDDCVQEVWLQLVVRLGEFEYDPQRGRFQTWLYTVVRSESIDFVRRKHRRKAVGDSNELPVVVPVEDNESDPALRFEKQDTQQLVRDVLDEAKKQVSPINFHVFYMRWMCERSVNETADELGLTREQVWFRQHRMKQRLSRLFIDHPSFKRDMVA